MCSNNSACFYTTLCLGVALAIQASTGRYAFAPKDPAAPMVLLPRLSHICAFPTSNDNKEYEDCSLYTAFLRITGTPSPPTHPRQLQFGRNARLRM